MAEPFLGEIRMVGFNFAPRGWAFCDGQILPINQNQALFSILGTTFGGDGRVSFALPDLRGRAPVHLTGEGDGLPGVTWGARGGAETVTLTSEQIPQHTHDLLVSEASADSPDPAAGRRAQSTSHAYGPASAPTVDFAPLSVAAAGAGQAHQNMQPYLAVNFCIALQGLFPARN